MGDLPTDVEGGLIIRDSNGDPTGTHFMMHFFPSIPAYILKGVFVDNAMTLIPRPEWTDKQLAQFFDATMKSALSYGLTSIHDADSSPRMINFMKKYVVFLLFRR